MNCEPALHLNPQQEQAARADHEDQVDAGRPPELVRVTVTTSWGWVVGALLPDEAAVRVEQVAVRKPNRSLIEDLASQPDRYAPFDGFQGRINLRLVPHWSAALFLFGTLTGSLARPLGLGWVAAICAGIIIPAELWLHWVRRGALWQTRTGTASAEQLAILACNPHTTAEQLWEAKDSPAAASRHITEMLPADAPTDPPRGGTYLNYPPTPQ